MQTSAVGRLLSGHIFLYGRLNARFVKYRVVMIVCGRFDTVMQPCWHEKANKRPAFSAICRSIDEFRHGGDTRTGYYAPNDVDTQSGYYAANDATRGGGTDSQIYDDGR